MCKFMIRISSFPAIPKNGCTINENLHVCRCVSTPHQPGRDANGAALALFTARLHRSNVTTHKAVLQAIIYQLDKAIER